MSLPEAAGPDRSGRGEAGLLSVVVPAHDEVEAIEPSLEAILASAASCAPRCEVIVVDDGSTDGTFARVAGLARQEPRIKAVRLSRNFGKEAALLAGLRAAGGEAVVTLDADLQHPPRLIASLYKEWQGGAKIVNAVKRSRDSEGPWARFRAAVFNRLLSGLGALEMTDSSDFKLLDRLVVDALVRQLPERLRFYRGLTSWVGYPSARVPFDVEPRRGGQGKWSSWRLVALAVTALVSFTSAPLRIVSVLGLVTLLLGVGVGADALWSWLHGRSVSGFATVIMTLLIIGSFIMISLGIMGEYVAKLYEEIKQRPTYLVEDTVGFESPEP